MQRKKSALSEIQLNLRKWRPTSQISKKRKKELMKIVSVWLQPGSTQKSKKMDLEKLILPKETKKSRQVPKKPRLRPASTINTPESPRNVLNQMEIDTKPVDVFRFPIIEWDYRWQRPQQLSSKFAQDGARVFYFSMKTIPLQIPDASYDDIAQSLEVNPLDDNIWSVTLCSKEPLNPYTNLITDPIDLQYLTWSIQALKERFRISQTLSIIDIPFWYQLVQYFDPSENKIIYDCMDEHSGFKNSIDELLQIEDTLMENADIVTVSSQTLYHKAKRYNSNVFYLPNACEYEHFSQEPETLALELYNLSGPIIGFYGAIANWFDVELINQLASRNPSWTFVLIGHYYEEQTETFLPLDNVILLGEKPYHDLPKYLYAFDVCLIPFKQIPLTLATNPVKVYEYLCSGKPVVATKLPELEPLSELVYLAENLEQFEESIQSALDESGAEDENRRQFAAGQTWDTRYSELNSIMKKNLYPKISIIIPVYNQWNYTEECLRSLLQASAEQNIEIIIVDNASIDGTRIALAAIRHPAIQVVSLSNNKGYAAAISLGSQVATGDYLVFLNNDTIVPDRWLDRLLAPLKRHADIGMVGPMSNSVGNDQNLDFFVSGTKNSWDNKWLENFYALNNGHLRDTERLGFYCVAIKKKVYEQVGELDIGYTIGMFEDDDYCERVINSGYRLVVVEDAFVYHHGSVTFKQMDQEKMKAIFNQNKRYYEKKWNKAWKPHKRPVNLFYGVMNGNEAAGIVSGYGSPCTIIDEGSNWIEIKEAWKDIVLPLVEEEHLVIIYSTSYCNQAVHGIRRIGPQVYVTNQKDWLRAIENLAPNADRYIAPDQKENASPILLG